MFKIVLAHSSWKPVFARLEASAGSALALPFGLCVDGARCPRISDGRASDIRIVPSLNSLIKDSLDAVGVPFQWTSLWIHRGECEDWRPVCGCIGPVLVGTLSGSCDSELTDRGAAGMSIRNGWAVLANASTLQIRPPVGARFVVTAFQHPARDEISTAMKAQLKALGFVLSCPAAWVAPLRCELDTSEIRAGRMTYVGRGCRRLRLEPSVWGNPFRIGRGTPRAEAVQMYEKHLGGDTDLLARLPELEGRRIACHCRLGQACHGDALTRAFCRLRASRLNAPLAAPPTERVALSEAARRRAVAGTDVPPAGARGRVVPTVWAGSGEPIFVGNARQRSLLADGGGLCSPGQWPPWHRLPADGPAAVIQQAITAELNALPHESSAKAIFGGLIAGSTTADPFPPPATARLRAALERVAAAHPWDSVDTDAVLPQPIDVLLLGSLLRAVGDPDAEIMALYATGVPLGLGVDLPRTPAVFPPKERWRLGEQASWGGCSLKADSFMGSTRSNYPSAVHFASEVEAVLDVQAARGQILVLSERDARGLHGDRLAIASLAAIEKGVRDDGSVDVRVIHDGTHGVDVNRYIRVADGAIFPTAADLKTCLRLQAESRAFHVGLTLDVKEAHRCVAVRPLDWPLQACQVRPGGPVYLNKVGTYGVASAAYWWGRLAAALHRLGLTVLGRELPLWAKLFADDWDLTGVGDTFIPATLGFVWILVALGVPISWKKSRGGGTYSWIGYELSLRQWSLGISATRADWAIRWFDRTVAAGRIAMQELRESLGRLGFVYGVLQWDKPFLAPLYAFASRHPVELTVKLPLYVTMVLTWLRDRLTARRAHPVRRRLRIPSAIMRVDAKAEGDTIAVGGWAPAISESGDIDMARSPWFSLTLTEGSAPWAFIKGVPARMISTLELLATTVGLVLLSPPALGQPGAAGVVGVTGLTDSQVSSAVVSRGLTTAFPLCCVAMELAAHLESRAAELDLEWIPRDQNAEADRLADGVTDGFAPAMRRGTSFNELRWLVLDGLMAAGANFYKESGDRARVRHRAPRTGQRRPARAPLREREPW